MAMRSKGQEASEAQLREWMQSLNMPELTFDLFKDIIGGYFPQMVNLLHLTFAILLFALDL